MSDPILRNRSYMNKALIGLLFLSILSNVAIGGLAWKTHQDQRVIAADLHTTMVRTQPLIGWNESVDWGSEQPVLDRFHEVEERLHDLESWSGSNYLVWVNRNFDQLNRLLILGNRTDFDRDGVVDAKDECPTIPGDPSYNDHPGCPTADRDGDNVVDVEDVCPDEGYEDGVWYYKYDGRFRTFQTSKESLSFSHSVRNQVEAAFYGCMDRDKDGVADRIDNCPDNRSRNDANLDGCEDEWQDLSAGSDFTLTSNTPRYRNHNGKKIGVFRATRTVGGVVINFNLGCEALDASGEKITADVEKPAASSWGRCFPVR